MVPDAVFKTLAAVAVIFSLIYRKRMGEWPWE